MGSAMTPSATSYCILYKQLHFHDIKGPSILNGNELPPIQSTLVDASLAVKATNKTCLDYDVSTMNLAMT
jgi:hypothetical protein